MLMVMIVLMIIVVGVIVVMIAASTFERTPYVLSYRFPKRTL